jgi:hypothetical protein
LAIRLARAAGLTPAVPHYVIDAVDELGQDDD